MHTKRVRLLVLYILCCGLLLARAQEMDKELSNLASKLAGLTLENGKKKVSVLDFTDLQGGATELGKYIAEELIVDLVMVKTNFSVLDRANLRKILAEHKLTATGLVDPENAKKLGQFAGVDALILGTIIPKDQRICLTAKIIATDSAEIVGAAKAEFKEDKTVQQMASRTATDSTAPGSVADTKDDQPKVVKSFGDLRVELRSIKMVNSQELHLTMAFTNQNAKRPMWVALSGDQMGLMLKAQVVDSAGSEFRADRRMVSGISVGSFARYGYQPNTFSPATEIKNSDSVLVSMKLASPYRKTPAAGKCIITFEILHGSRSENGAAGDVTFHTFTGDVDLE